MLLMDNKKKPKKDPHKVKVTGVRIPPEYRDLWQRISDAEDRGLSKVFIRALREYAEKHGYDLPSPPGKESK